jgi:hypothetical protein
MGDLLEEPGNGAPLQGAMKVMNGSLWGWAQLGNLEWAPLPGTSGYG